MQKRIPATGRLDRFLLNRSVTCVLVESLWVFCVDSVDDNDCVRALVGRRQVNQRSCMFMAKNRRRVVVATRVVHTSALGTAHVRVVWPELLTDDFRELWRGWRCIEIVGMPSRCVVVGGEPIRKPAYPFDADAVQRVGHMGSACDVRR